MCIFDISKQLKHNKMKFPSTFTNDDKIIFYKQRSKSLHSKLKNAEDKDKLYAKILDEIMICHDEINKIKN